MIRFGKMVIVAVASAVSACDPASLTTAAIDADRLDASIGASKQGTTSSQILFEVMHDLGYAQDFEIFAMNDDGTGIIQLAADPSYAERSASWAPDGKRVLFRRAAVGSFLYGICVMNPDGTGVTQLTFVSSGTEDDRPAAFGKHVVFARQTPSNSVIYMMNADGTGLTQLTQGPNDVFASPSPKGGVIAVGRNGDIDLLDVATLGFTSITNPATHEIEPAFSPSGKQIAFTRLGPNGGIFVMHSDGTQETRLTTNGASYSDRAPHWSPDGKRIAFTSGRDGSLDIFVMNADGTAITNLTRTPTVNESVTAWARN